MGLRVSGDRDVRSWHGGEKRKPIALGAWRWRPRRITEARYPPGGEVNEMSSRKAIAMRLALLCVSAVLVIAAAASAQSASAFGLYGCKEVGSSSLGQYTESHCATDAAHGKYTWTWATDQGLSTDYCLLVGGGGGGNRYVDADCSTSSGSGAFEAVELPNEPYFWLLGTTSAADGVNSTVLGIKVEVACPTMEFAGQPLTLTLISLAKAKLSKCEVKTPANCTVSSPGEASGNISTSVLDGVLASGTKVTITLKPVSGTAFMTVDFSGASCSVTGIKAEITGSQACSFGASVSTPATEQAVTCEPSGSALSYLGAAVTVKANDTLMLEPILWWKIT
jgi:hypothetical protein